MAYDNVTFELHLTPDGWKSGERPSNAVLSMNEHIYQRSQWSAEETTHTVTWKSSKVSQETIDKLLKKFPR
ncbi:MAG: hypothetical protein ABSF98_27060 [Bryobacteraceae bacterium]